MGETAGECTNIAMRMVLLVAMPASNPELVSIRVAYRSMSWSTNSRERAKLGRLDSEPPLLLREWPPET